METETARHDLDPLVDPTETAFPGVHLGPPLLGWKRWHWIQSSHPEILQAQCAVEATSGDVRHGFGTEGVDADPGVDLRGVSQCGFRRSFRGDGPGVYTFRAHWTVEHVQTQSNPGPMVTFAAGLRLGAPRDRLGDFEILQGTGEVALSFSGRLSDSEPRDLVAFLQIQLQNPSTGVLTPPGFGRMRATLRGVRVLPALAAEVADSESETPLLAGRGTPAVEGGTVALDEPVPLSEILIG